MSELLRHIRACNNAVLPGLRWRVMAGDQPVGWVLPDTARAASICGAVLRDGALHLQPETMQAVARGLSERGLCRWRAEEFDVRAQPDGPVLGQIDRGTLPALGLRATGVHLNGLVGDRLWVAKRARTKALDPGKYDHLVAGGVAAGHSLVQTLVKEGEEEAGLSPDLSSGAVAVSTIDYAMERPEGLRRDRLHVYDLELSPEFQPIPQDGEVEAFELWPLGRVLDTVRRTDDFKFNVNLVLIDLFIRRGVIPADEAADLAVSLQAGSR